MKIGINILYLIPGKVGGTETYARELLSALTKEIKSGDELVIFLVAKLQRHLVPYQRLRLSLYRFIQQTDQLALLPSRPFCHGCATSTKLTRYFP